MCRSQAACQSSRNRKTHAKDLFMRVLQSTDRRLRVVRVVRVVPGPPGPQGRCAHTWPPLGPSASEAGTLQTPASSGTPQHAVSERRNLQLHPAQARPTATWPGQPPPFITAQPPPSSWLFPLKLVHPTVPPSLTTLGKASTTPWHTRSRSHTTSLVPSVNPPSILVLAKTFAVAARRETSVPCSPPSSMTRTACLRA